MLKEIGRKAYEVKRLTNERISKTNEVIQKIVNILEANNLDDYQTLRRFDYKDYGFRRIRSNVGSEVDIWYLEDGYRVSRFPASREDFGKMRYLHGDFNSDFYFMSYEKTKEFIEILPEFIENLKKVLDEIRKEVEGLPSYEININKVE